MPGYKKNRVTWLLAFLITRYESILSTVSPSAGCSVFLSNHSSRKQSCPATRSRREDQALLLRRRLPLVPNKASSDAGPELAGRESHEAMESPEALMCPLEKGDRGIEISKSSRWQPCCWAIDTVFILFYTVAFCRELTEVSRSDYWNLSGRRRVFTDKLFKIKHLSGKRRGFTDELSFTDGLWLWLNRLWLSVFSWF